MGRRSLALVAAGLLVSLLALALLSSCGGKKQIFAPDVGAPETYVFVQFPADTDTALVNQHRVNHLVHLYWFGTYTHGDVSGYRFRFLYPGDPPAKAWSYSARTDSQFAIYTPNGVSTPVFQVAAYVVSGRDTLFDATPAQQRFAFNNQPPAMSFTSAPRTTDTTFASLTLAWTAADPDGDAGQMRFRVWLGSDTTDVRIASGTGFTLPSDLFYKDSSTTTRRETVWVQPIDDGGMLGTRVSANWVVRRPIGMPDGRLTHGRLLVVSDLGAGLDLFDSLYVNSADRVLPGQYDLLRTRFTQPFKSAQDIAQTFRLFDAVVWYRGPGTSVSKVLQNGQSALEGYISSGGRLFIEGLNLFGDPLSSSLSADFVPRFLGSSGLAKVPVPESVDSTTVLSIDAGMPLYSPQLQDSLSTVAGYNGLRGFAVNDTADVVVWARAGALTPANTVDIPLGVMVDQAGGGRCAVVAIPLRGCDGFATAGEFVTRLLAKFLGLSIP